jgi:hypothetical protein
MAQGQPRQKVSNTLSPKTSQVWWSKSVIPATQEEEVGRSQSWASLSKSARPYLESKLKVKGLGDTAQVVECMPRNCKALSSNPSKVREGEGGGGEGGGGGDGEGEGEEEEKKHWTIVHTLAY